jgi:hypothetical protein
MGRSLLFSWRDRQPRPAREKAETAKGRNCSEPAKVCQRHDIQAPTKNNDSSKEQPPCAAIRDAEKSKHQERKRVNEMIKHSLVPDVEHSVRFEYWLETMCPESAQCDGKKTKRRRNSEK